MKNYKTEVYQTGIAVCVMLVIILVFGLTIISLKGETPYQLWIGLGFSLLLELLLCIKLIAEVVIYEASNEYYNQFTQDEGASLSDKSGTTWNEQGKIEYKTNEFKKEC